MFNIKLQRVNERWDLFLMKLSSKDGKGGKEKYNLSDIIKKWSYDIKHWPITHTNILGQLLV